MKERKREVRVALGIVLTVCLFFGVAYWTLIRQEWQMIAALVVIGIFASVIFLSKKTVKEIPGEIWLWCGAFCLIAFFATGIGTFFGTLYKKAQIQIRAENAIEEYMGSRGSYIENTKGVISTDDIYARFGIWKTEKGQITLLLVEITGEDIGPVREIPIPVVWSPGPVKISAIPAGPIWMLPEPVGCEVITELKLVLPQRR